VPREPLRLLEIVTAAGSNTTVVIEATFGWYWHDA
jgi:hypothetical protein